LSEIDFTALLGHASGPSQHVVVLKFLEAALRLRGALKQAASAVFKAFGLQLSAQYHRTWPSLLALDAVDDVDALFKPRKDEDALALRRLPAGGALILAALLRFPSEVVAPVTSGLSKILRKDLLTSLAMEARTARVLEAALAPSSALGGGLRLRLARAFKGSMQQLGPHPIGGWVCAALWRASLADTALRETFAKELLQVEDRLRQENFAVWKVCGLHQAKMRSEQWAKQQRKAGKVQALFGDILDGDAEAAKAAVAAKIRAAEDDKMAKASTAEDPIVQMLLS